MPPVVSQHVVSRHFAEEGNRYSEIKTEVSGKAQKYSRICGRKFVLFEHTEVTLHNIENTCKRHFAPVVAERMVCDVLASEQGPSCKFLTLKLYTYVSLSQTMEMTEMLQV